MQLAIDFSVTQNGKKAPQYRIGNDLSGEISMEDFFQLMRNTIITVALDATREEQAKGFDKNPVIIVDNKRNLPVEKVNPFGKIEVISRLKSDTVFADLYFDLLRLSPVETGTYYRSHRVVVNGTQVASSYNEWVTWLKGNQLQDRDIIRFVNAMPYAGFLERHGATSNGSSNIKKVKSRDKRKRAADSEGMVRRANGAYYLTARSYKRKYKGNSFIGFDWMPGNQLGLTYPQSGPRGPLRTTFAKPKPPRKARYTGFYVYPVITIRVRGEGIR